MKEKIANTPAKLNAQLSETNPSRAKLGDERTTQKVYRS